MLRPCALLDGVLGTGEGMSQLLPVGRRDGLLLELQQAWFGPTLEALTQCPQCGEQLEMNLRVADLRVPGLADVTDANAVVSITFDDYCVRGRLPDSRDLAAAARAVDLNGARQTLIQSCVLDASCQSVTLSAQELPDAVLEQLGKAMYAADPQANTELALQCPACVHHWSEPFDIGSYLLASLEHWVERCLDQVHVLAQAYGWSEAQILALSPARRASYIARVLS
jgi:hypothetical protein